MSKQLIWMSTAKKTEVSFSPTGRLCPANSTQPLHVILNLNSSQS